MPNIRMPDGVVVSFPDDMPKEEIVKAIQDAQKRVDEENDYVFSDEVAIKDEEKSFKGDVTRGFKSAYYGSQLGFNYYTRDLYHNLANVPGFFLSDKDKEDARKDVDDGGLVKRLAKKSYDTLKDFEEIQEKKFEKIKAKAPDTFLTKLYTGVGAAPGMASQYAGAIGLLRSPVAGVAAVDAVRASDEGVKEALIEGSKGALLGKYTELAASLAPVSRMVSLGALGFGMEAPDPEQRIVNSLTFAGLGAIGPITGKRTFIERDISKIIDANQRRKIKKELDSYVSDINKNHAKTIDMYEAFELKKKGYLNEINTLNAKLKKIKDPFKKQQIQDNIAGVNKSLRSVRASQGKLKKDIELLDDFLVDHDLFVTPLTKQFIDERSPSEFRLDSVRKVKTKDDKFDLKRTYKDLPDKFINTIERTISPGEFASKNYPVFKKYIDELNIYRVTTEGVVKKFLDNPKFFDGKLGITALRYGKQEASDGGMLVRFNRLSKQEKEDLIPKTFKIESEYAKFIEVPKKDRVFDKFDSDGTVTDSYLKQLALNDDQILAYKDIMDGFEKGRKLYNAMAKEYGGYRIDPIARRPNFFPHIFTGNYRIFIKEKSTGKLIDTSSHVSKATAEITKKQLQKKYPASEYEMNVRTVKRNIDSDDSIHAFTIVNQFLNKDKHSKLRKEFKEIESDIIAKRGFNMHKLPRRRYDEVKGYLGTKAGKKGVDDYNLAIKLYMEGLVKSAYGFRLRGILNKIANEPLPGQNKSLKNLYPNSVKAGEIYYNRALGRDKNGITKLINEIENKTPELRTAYGKVAGLANHFYLLQLNIRFALAQGIQPYQMIPSKMAHLSELAGKNSVEAIADAYTTVALIQKELIRPNKFSQALIKEGAKKATINDNFLREFAGPEYYQKGNFADKGTFPKRINFLIGRNLASNMEQFSRLNAVLMFGHHLKRLGASEKEAIKKAWQMADTYMVRYDAFERAPIFQALGTPGRALGQFKTFVTNYFAQMVEGLKGVPKGQVSQISALVVGSLLTAGAGGMLGAQAIDGIINKINKLLEKNYPTWSEWLLRMDLPDWVYFGVPSAILNSDMTATVSAPTFAPGDIISVPAYDFAKNAASGFITIMDYYVNDVLVNKLYDIGVKPTREPFIGKIPPATTTLRDAFKNVTPNSMHGLIDEWFQKNSSNPYYVSGGNARIQRNTSDRISRVFLTSYSLREARIIKVLNAQRLSDKTASLNFDKVMDFLADNYFKTGEPFIIPEFLYQYMIDLGYTDESIERSLNRRIKNRIMDAKQKMEKGGINLKEEPFYEMLD